ncbi:hypothetical protein V8B97DRAFT_1990688 [Scleroderma yunnanense]
MLQREKQCIIYCNRPHTAEATIPPTLLHTVFGQFVDNCNMHQITPEDDSLALGLHTTMSDFYADEDTRAKAICAEFSKFGIHFVVSRTSNGYTTHGDISVKGYHFVIAVFMNELCSTGAEPYHQAILHYLDSTRHFAATMRDSPLPCMILLFLGPYIIFAGATWNSRPVVQPLSALTMCYHPTHDDMWDSAARHLGALKTVVRTLKEYYRDLSDDPLFPHYTSFSSLQDGLQYFNYTFQPFGDKLIFFANLSNGQPVCIKFARRYSKAAHEICASLGCAPTLRAVERIPGKWFMIVMDKLSDEYVTLSVSTPSTSVINNIRNVLELLHSKGYVLGNVRNTNIMVSKSKSMLVDFELAGKIDEVRYPTNMNKGLDFWWPEGAVCGDLIMAEHDVRMLNYITTSTPDGGLTS